MNADSRSVVSTMCPTTGVVRLEFEPAAPTRTQSVFWVNSGLAFESSFPCTVSATGTAGAPLTVLGVTVIHSHVARIESLLIERERRRHRDAALVGERVRVRPEPHVQAEGTQAHAPAETELDPLALVARDAAAHRDQADALLAAHVHRR